MSRQTVELFREESGAPARLEIERRMQPRRRVAFHQHAVVHHRVQPFASAQEAVPLVADGDVAHLVAQDRNSASSSRIKILIQARESA